MTSKASRDILFGWKIFAFGIVEPIFLVAFIIFKHICPFVQFTHALCKGLFCYGTYNQKGVRKKVTVSDVKGLWHLRHHSRLCCQNIALIAKTFLPKPFLKITSVVRFTDIIAETSLSPYLVYNAVWLWGCHVQVKYRHYVQMEDIRFLYRRAHSHGSFHHFCRQMGENYESKASLSSLMPLALDVLMR